ncbi:MAG: Nucleotidyltransferase substrate binding protein, HI0074 family [Berkelbacteria bacterium GW2011_GWA2_38_9]|uniref:Nucleotidyltransferase substrate binding protein, HI0074 family n=1 Tax=Berkelbacteria bacterium GW2011_GWA2_38_9 TaxID=1618334 RepID=A0A0G0NUU6_9BACT|nr:MAG: Nucleotidyltransferase substrate binding protein, HI0074 family [Berkelbacteria bacterium GW2011_GWA2_38_9]
MENQLILKIKSEFNDLIQAHSRLNEALEAEKTSLNRDASIQRFEFTFEIVWKLLKSINEYKGTPCFSPRDCFRIGAQNGLIDDPTSWFEALTQRNNTVHAYNEQKAKEVYSHLPQFSQDTKKLITIVRKEIEQL